MAREYSYSELMQMQDKAIERVRQMQERAKRTVEENPIDVSLPETEKTEEETKNKPVFSSSPESIPKNPFPQGSIKTDKDKATVLPLLLLLMRDGADKLLLLALIYIMA